MKRVLVVIAGLVWAFFAFMITLWVTFPGSAVARRVEYQVGQQSRGNYALSLGDVGPWWLGLSTASVKLYGRPGPGEDANQLVMYATDARMSAGLVSLITRQPRVQGSFVLGEEGRLDYIVGTALDEKGTQLRVTELDLGSDAFPLAELVLLIPGAQMDGKGTLQIDVELDAPDGLSKANGKIVIQGRELTLVNPVIAEFPIGRDVVFSQLELELEVSDGRGKIVRGRMASDVATIDLTGDVILADEPGRSRLDARAELTLDPSMKMMESMLSSAARDGKFMYRCSGPLNRLSSICSADGDRKTASRINPRARGRSTDVTAAEKGIDAKIEEREPVKDPNGSLTEEDRQKRREELQERLRQRREQREAERTGGAKRPEEGTPVDEELPIDEDPKDPGDEEIPPEEELPPEEEFVEE